ncbi:MAG: stage V sporulation protein D, partial [Clostridia bacterium]|nr:stage V sporulation protein D [Clostridia bacterium]
MAQGKKEDTAPHTPSSNRAMRWRALVVLLMIVVIAFGSVIGQLFSLQISQGDQLQQEAVSQQLSDTVTSPNRGTIYDSNRQKLAESQLVWTVIMSPAAIGDDARRVKIADEVSVLLEVDREALYKKTQKTYSQFEYVKKKIPRATVEKLVKWVSDNEMGGVFRVITDYKRVYPYGSLASTVLGFTGDENTGLYGLEAQYESVLAGEAGRVITTQNGWGEQMPNTLSYEKAIDAKDGNSLVLTIDQTIQHYAEKYLEEAVIATGCTNRGMAVVMDVKTGGILAMAVKGDYNPNDPFTIANPDTLAEIATLSGDEYAAARTAALQQQWNNKVVYDFYEPGSVFKVFTASMAIEEGVAHENSSFYCNGALKLPGVQPMHCHVRHGHGTQNFAQIISNSCNPAFMNLGLSIGNKSFFKYFSGFGFTSLTNIDMLGESQVTGSLYHGENMSDVSLATSSIGQTFKITPIQMITAISAVANGGDLMVPYVVAEQLDAAGNAVKVTTPTVRRQVISKDTAARVNAMLAAAVNGGGSRNAYVPGYRVAGKTGTAEKTENKDVNDVWASFAGFAPADDPQVAILVVLDEPQSDI